jgi:hypothetical protein
VTGCDTNIPAPAPLCEHAATLVLHIVLCNFKHDNFRRSTRLASASEGEDDDDMCV